MESGFEAAARVSGNYPVQNDDWRLVQSTDNTKILCGSSLTFVLAAAKKLPQKVMSRAVPVTPFR